MVCSFIDRPWALFYSVVKVLTVSCSILSITEFSLLSFYIWYLDATLFKSLWREKEWLWPGLSPWASVKWSNISQGISLLPSPPWCSFQSNQSHLGHYMTIGFWSYKTLGKVGSHFSEHGHCLTPGSEKGSLQIHSSGMAGFTMFIHPFNKYLCLVL